MDETDAAGRSEPRFELEAIEPVLAVLDGLPDATVATASIGIALGHEDAEALLAGADAAVYRAKAAGRGRVEVACA